MPCIDTDDKVLEHLGKTSMQSVWDEQGEASWHEAEAEIIPVEVTRLIIRLGFIS